METPNLPAIRALRPAWNKGRIVGQKRPLKPKHVWAVRVRMAVSQSPEQPLASAIGATIRTDRLTLHHPRMRLMISSSIWRVRCLKAFVFAVVVRPHAAGVSAQVMIKSFAKRLKMRSADWKASVRSPKPTSSSL